MVEMLKEICSENAVLVAQAYAFFAEEMSLEAFKAELKKAWRAGAVSLSRCDMPEIFSAAQVAASEIRHGVARLDMVQARAWK